MKVLLILSVAWAVVATAAAAYLFLRQSEPLVAATAPPMQQPKPDFKTPAVKTSLAPEAKITPTEEKSVNAEPQSPVEMELTGKCLNEGEACEVLASLYRLGAGGVPLN